MRRDGTPDGLHPLLGELSALRGSAISSAPSASSTRALEGLQEALRQRKASPTEIARHAERGGVATVVRPYLKAFTANA